MNEKRRLETTGGSSEWTPEIREENHKILLTTEDLEHRPCTNKCPSAAFAIHGLSD